MQPQARMTLRRADRDAIRYALNFALAAMLAALAACGGGGGDSGGGLTPFFEFAFEGVTATATNTRLTVNLAFFTRNVSADKKTGEFDTASRISVTDYSGDQPTTSAATLSGTFSGSNMTLNVTPEPGGTYSFPTQYQGTFTDADTVRLTPATGGGASITLRRNDNTFIPAVTGNWSGQSTSGQPWLIQLRTDSKFTDDSSATVFLTGTEVLGGQFSRITGHANVHAIVLDIQRPGGTMQVTGNLTANTGKFTTSMTLGNSQALTRGGITDAASVIFFHDTSPTNLQSANLGGQPITSVMSQTWSSCPAVCAVVSPDKQKLAVATNDNAGDQELHLYSFATGTATQVTQLGTDGQIFEIAWAPDSQSLAIVAKSQALPAMNVFLITPSPTPAQVKNLTNTASATTSIANLTWAPAGQALAYVSTVTGRSELYVRSSPATSTTSTAVSTAAGTTGSGLGQYQWAPSGGQLVAFTANTVVPAGTSPRLYDLYTINRDGTGLHKINTVAEPDDQIRFAWSPDASRVAFGAPSAGSGRSNYGLYSRPPDAGSAATLHSDAAIGTKLEWNPAGTAILLQTAPLNSDTYPWSIVPLAGTSPVVLPDSGPCEAYAHWSTDGSWVGFTHVINPTGGYTCRLDIARADGTGQRALSGENFNGSDFVWVDGKRVVFMSDEDNVKSIFLPPYMELFVAQAGGTGAIKLSSKPLDSQAVAFGWVVKKP